MKYGRIVRAEAAERVRHTSVSPLADQVPEKLHYEPLSPEVLKEMTTSDIDG